jgi:multidrug resistance efflux pump
MNSKEKLIAVLPHTNEEVVSELSYAPKWIFRHGGLLILLFFVCIVVVAYVVPNPKKLSGDFTITSEEPPITINSRDIFTIDKLAVKDLDTVRRGDFIAFNKTDANLEEVLRLKSQVEATDLTQLGTLVLTGFSNLGRLQKPYEEFYRISEEYQLMLSSNVNNQELVLKKNNLIALRNQINAGKDLLKTLTSNEDLLYRNFQRYKKLAATMAISPEEAEEKEQRWLSSQRERKQQYENLQLLQTQEQQLLDDIKLTEIKNTESSALLYLELSASFRLLKTSIEDWITDNSLVSTISGTVHYADFWVQGQQVETNTHLFTLLPLVPSNIRAKVKLDKKGVGDLSIGQTVWLSLDNYPDKEYGKLKGSIEYISPYSRNDFHLVTVKVPTPLITSYKKTIPFQQNLTGKLEVVVLNRSLLESVIFNVIQISSP